MDDPRRLLRFVRARVKRAPAPQLRSEIDLRPLGGQCWCHPATLRRGRAALKP
jgi:hypothetical protein